MLSGIGGFVSVCMLPTKLAVRCCIQRKVNKRFRKLGLDTPGEKEEAKTSCCMPEDPEPVWKDSPKLEAAKQMIEKEKGKKVPDLQELREDKMLEKQLRQLAYLDHVDQWLKHDGDGSVDGKTPGCVRCRGTDVRQQQEMADSGGETQNEELEVEEA